MLTGELLRYEMDNELIRPRYITRRQGGYYLRVAGDLIELYRSHIGKTRRELNTALDTYESDRVNYKILRGLAKMLDDFAEFGAKEERDYPAVREVVFELAEKHRPVIRTRDLLYRVTGSDILRELQDQIGIPASDIVTQLYGDLPENQVLLRLEREIQPYELIRRYNLALAQGLLYHCVRMEVRLWDSYKTVFKYLKLAGLMHHLRREGEGYFLAIDGPFSLFQRTQKYGVAMARFLPGLLLARKWEMKAEVHTPDGRRLFVLDHNLGLQSHYPREHPFDSDVEEEFYKSFVKKSVEWRVEREAEIVDLGDTVFIPDFKFTRPDGCTALLEIVGFWTPEYLTKKLDKLRRANRRDILVAVNENLNCAREDFAGPVIFYKTRVPVKEVLKILEKSLDF